jgi:o-succinylbenzoate---CoA ligase
MMHKGQYSQLRINGEIFNRESLIVYAQEKLMNHDLSEWENAFFDFILSWLDDSDRINLSTSGSTGKPRVLQMPKSRLAESAIRTGSYLNLENGQSALLALPVGYIAGQMMVVRGFVLGLNLIPVTPDSNPLKNSQLRLNFAALTPMQVLKTIESENGPEKIRAIDKLIIGGDAVSNELKEVLSGFDNQIWSTYGMTETLTHVAMQKLTNPNPSACFEALPGITFGTDERGCLVIYGAGLNERGIKTNDLVNLISKTSFDFIGRFDNVINSGGVKISPERVEKLMAPVLRQKRFIVSGIPDRYLGKRLVLVVECDKKEPLNINHLVQNSGLKKHEVPKEIYFVDHFPETETGKIIRGKVPDLITP